MNRTSSEFKASAFWKILIILKKQAADLEEIFLKHTCDRDLLSWDEKNSQNSIIWNKQPKLKISKKFEWRYTGGKQAWDKSSVS